MSPNANWDALHKQAARPHPCSIPPVARGGNTRVTARPSPTCVRRTWDAAAGTLRRNAAARTRQAPGGATRRETGRAAPHGTAERRHAPRGARRRTSQAGGRVLHAAPTPVQHVRVEHRRAHVLVPQQLLHVPEVVAVCQQRPPGRAAGRPVRAALGPPAEPRSPRDGTGGRPRVIGGAPRRRVLCGPCRRWDARRHAARCGCPRRPAGPTQRTTVPHHARG